MIIDFAITNFRSIKETQSFSMLPSTRVKDRKNQLQTNKEYPTLEVFPLAVIYGANNTGKSNLITAFRALRWLVLNSHKFTVGDLLTPNENFLFDIQTQDAPTTFELDFIAADNKRYLYLVQFNKNQIIREELHFYRISEKKKITRRKLFIREANKSIQFGDEFKGIKKPIEDRLIENMLFVSKAVQENSKMLRPVVDFFQKRLKITTMSEGYIDFQNHYLGKLALESDNSPEMQTLNQALRDIDSGILYLEVKKNADIPSKFVLEDVNEKELDEKDKIIREKILDTLKHEIQAVHRLFDDKVEISTQGISLAKESEGTRKFIALFPKLMELGTNGGIFIVDELERSLHPLLTKALLAIISNPETNPKQAQLIFTSHDFTLFDVLDRDQINIIEKDQYGASEIYAVSDIKGLRNDMPLKKWYSSGKIGGIPNINLDSIKQNLNKLYEQGNQAKG